MLYTIEESTQYLVSLKSANDSLYDAFFPESDPYEPDEHWIQYWELIYPSGFKVCFPTHLAKMLLF